VERRRALVGKVLQYFGCGFTPAERTAVLTALSAQAATLARIEASIGLLVKGETTMAGNLDALTASVAKNATVIGSALVLIQGFSAQLAAAGTDPTALAALQKSIDDNDTALAAAVAAGTPAALPTA
jgi:hypothetical protein